MRSGVWCGAAFRLIGDVQTLAKYATDQANVDKIPNFLLSKLCPALDLLYDSTQARQVFLWETYYKLDTRLRAAALTALDVLSQVPKVWSLLDESELARVQGFVRSDGATMARILNLECDITTRYIHGDLNAANILVGMDEQSVVLIDFAQSDVSHAIKDIAKLEADFVCTLHDNPGHKHTDWRRLSEWLSIIPFYQKSRIWDIPESRDDEIVRLLGGLRRCGKVLAPKCREEELLLSLLTQYIRYLTYQDVSLQKRALAVKLSSEILKQFDGD